MIKEEEEGLKRLIYSLVRSRKVNSQEMVKRAKSGCLSIHAQADSVVWSSCLGRTKAVLKNAYPPLR